MIESGRLVVLYGSQTFTAQEAAERLWRTSKALGFRGPVQPLDEYPVSQLIHEAFAIFVCSTAGQGEEPDNMKKFWKFLLRKSLPSNSLVKLKFGVIGLGDSTFPKFNFVAKKLHKRLIQLGATPFIDIGLCDWQHDLGHDAVLIPWTKEFFSKLKHFFPSIELDNIDSTFIPRWKVSLIKDNSDVEIDREALSEDIYFSGGKTDDFIDAKLLEVEINNRITDENHFQDVRFMTLRTADSSHFDYTPGDVVNVRPRNCKEDMDDFFEIFETHNIDIKPHYRLLVEERYDDMPVPQFLKEPPTMYEIVEQYWDLKAYPTQYVFSLLALISEDKLERDKCIELSSPEGQEEWLNYSRRPKRTILEVLHDFHKSAAKLTIEVLFELFCIIKPRSFSIASSSLLTPQKVDLLMAVVTYQTILKKPREGLCSNWLKTLKVGDRIYGWLKKGSFVFPDDASIPLISICPGTGLAPIRSLILERIHLGTASSDILYIFFGCRYRNKDYHCGEELEKMAGEEKLTLFCAFSRDQEHKVYVQHKISEQKELLYDLINNKRAIIYISGNAKNMPYNVQDAIIEDVLGKTGGMNLQDAKELMKKFEEQRRLQIETW